MFDSIRNMGDGYFRVPLNCIEIIDSCKKEASGFINPRYASKNPKGLDPKNMSVLADSIAITGMLHAPAAKFKKDAKGNIIGLRLLSGERRLRSVQRLVAEDHPVGNRLVYNRGNGKVQPASQVYAEITCSIYDFADDKDGLIQEYEIAFSENENSIKIGPAADVKFVMYLKSIKMEDHEIIKITKKPEDWIKECEKLATLDPYSWEAFETDVMDRKAALKLTDIPAAERKSLILKAKEALKLKIQKEAAAIEAEAETIANKISVANDDIKLAEKMKSKDAKKDAQSRISRLTLRSSELNLERDKLVGSSVITTRELDLPKASKARTGGDGPLSPSKIKKRWLPLLKQVVSDGKLVDGTDLTQYQKEAKSVLAVLTMIEKGHDDVVSLLKEIQKVA